jgi:hypothetical protein
MRTAFVSSVPAIPKVNRFPEGIKTSWVSSNVTLNTDCASQPMIYRSCRVPSSVLLTNSPLGRPNVRTMRPFLSYHLLRCLSGPRANASDESGATSLIKFAVPDPPNDPTRYTYPDLFEVLDDLRERLVIAPSGNHVSLLFELAGCWELKSFWLLYVLLVPRGNHEAGRYESPNLLTSDDLRVFLARFGPFLEQDGRHTFWIGSPAGEGTLVYDQHDVIFAYGPIGGYREVLNRRGFVEQSFSYPDPHVHWYHAIFDTAEDELLAMWQRRHSPLHDDDHY